MYQFFLDLGAKHHKTKIDAKGIHKDRTAHSTLARHCGTALCCFVSSRSRWEKLALRAFGSYGFLAESAISLCYKTSQIVGLCTLWIGVCTIRYRSSR